MRTDQLPGQRTYFGASIQVTICLIIAMMLFGSPCTSSNSPATTEWNIPAGDLETALNNFGLQSGILLSFKTEIIESLKTQGVQGAYSVNNALLLILRDTGLELITQPKGFTIQAHTKQFQAIKVTGLYDDSYGYLNHRTSAATKTDTPLLDIPQSITLINSQQIRDQGIQSLTDAVRFVPGINIAQGEGSRDSAVFRGNISSGDFFLDGMRDDVQYIRDLYNVEQIEILKGPTAMLFGRGGAGGAINRVTKVATWKPKREITMTGGSWENRRVTTDFGEGVNTDIAARVTALYEDSNSFRQGFNLKRYGINPTTTIKIGDPVITIGYEHFKDERTTDRGIPSWNGAPLDTSPSTFFGDPDISTMHATVGAFNAKIEEDINEQLQVRNSTRIASYEKFYQNAFPGPMNTLPINTSLPGTLVNILAYNSATERDNIFNQTDLVYSFKTNRTTHNVVTGIEFGKQKTANFREWGYFVDPQNPNGDMLSSIWVPVSAPKATPIEFRHRPNDINNKVDASNISIYAQDQIDILKNTKIVAGFRYDYLDTTLIDNRDDSQLESTDNLIAPRLGFIYKPAENLSIYTSYSLAYIPRSGEQTSSLTPSNAELDPEKFINYEVGTKWDLGKNLAASIAIYRLTRSDVAVIDPANPNELIASNTDSQRSDGLELSIEGNLSSVITFIAGYSYMDGRIIKDIQTSENTLSLAGSTLANAPKHTFSMWGRYDLNSQAGIGLGAVNRSEIYTSLDNKVSIPDYTRIDAALYYQINDLTQLQLNIENLFDRTYYISAHSNDNISPGSPRALRLTLNINL